MPSYYEDNIDLVIDDLDAELPEEDHELTLTNDAEGAYWLQFMDGYRVFNDGHMMKEVRKHLQAAILAGRPLSDDEVVGALKTAANGEVAFLQSFTASTQPPVAPGGPERPAHPGGWADRTTETASSYTRHVDGQHERTYPYDELPHVPTADEE